MACFKKDAIFRFADATLLSVIFLCQHIILNRSIIGHFSSTFVPFLLFLPDFLCLMLFSFTLFVAYRSHTKAKKREKSFNMSSSNSVISNRTISRNSSNDSHYGLFSEPDCFSKASKLPFTYVSWVVYSTLLIVKVVILFKSEIPQHLKPDDFFGPQLIKFSIGLTSIIFSLLLEAHHDAQSDPLRLEYIKSISYSTALELLDSTSFLGLLIGSESHIVYTYRMENYIICLASANMMLPAIALYKLSLSNFGRTYSVVLGSLYKVLHLTLVDVPYLGYRLYLWQMFGSDISVFAIKNLYCIARFARDFYSETRRILDYCAQKSNIAKSKRHNSSIPEQVHMDVSNKAKEVGEP